MNKICPIFREAGILQAIISSKQEYENTAGRITGKLKKDVEILLECADFFRAEIDALLIPPVPGQWSIAQILEHFNSYGRFYLPDIDKAISSSQTERSAWFNSGFRGNYFTNMMKPKYVFEVKNKMRAMKAYSPQPELDPGKVLEEFMEQQHRLLQILEMAKAANMSVIRVPDFNFKAFKIKTWRYISIPRRP